MTAVNVLRVNVLNNPTDCQTPLAFEIEYECLYDLQDDLEWKMIYVGSAESEAHDQVLDSVLVGPVFAGNYKFTFEGNPPDLIKLPSDDVVGVTIVLLTCSYKVCAPCSAQHCSPAACCPSVAFKLRQCAMRTGQGVHPYWILCEQRVSGGRAARKPTGGAHHLQTVQKHIG